MKLLFAGDLCPINRIEQLVLSGSSDSVFGNVLTELHDKDLSVVNLECPLTESKSSICKSGPHLKAHPKTAECLKTGGFDIVSLANNHIADYGPSGVRETCTLLKSNNIEFVGAGSSLSEAKKPLIVQFEGKQIAFLAFAENEFNCADETNAGAWPLDPTVNLSEIRRAKTDADIVVVLVHGGNEFNPVPSPRIVRTYRAFVDAGASTVVGTHPHVPQGYEIYNNAPIFYSIGNLVLDFAKRITRSTLWSKGFVVRLHIQEHVVKDFEIIPYKALTETGCLRLLEGEELSDFVDYIEFLSGILGNEREVKEYWEAWCALMGPKYLRSLSRFSFINFLYPLKPTRNPASKGFLVTRNIMACQAHNELLTTFMDLVRKKRIDAAKKYIPHLKTLQKGVIPSAATTPKKWRVDL